MPSAPSSSSTVPNPPTNLPATRNLQKIARLTVTVSGRRVFCASLASSGGVGVEQRASRFLRTGMISDWRESGSSIRSSEMLAPNAAGAWWFWFETNVYDFDNVCELGVGVLFSAFEGAYE